MHTGRGNSHAKPCSWRPVICKTWEKLGVTFMQISLQMLGRWQSLIWHTRVYQTTDKYSIQVVLIIKSINLLNQLHICKPHVLTFQIGWTFTWAFLPVWVFPTKIFHLFCGSNSKKYGDKNAFSKLTYKLGLEVQGVSKCVISRTEHFDPLIHYYLPSRTSKVWSLFWGCKIWGDYPSAEAITPPTHDAWRCASSGMSFCFCHCFIPSSV